MIRPSALKLAESCGLASRLAEQYPESSEAATRGRDLHVEIASWLTGKSRPASAEVIALARIWQAPAGVLYVEKKVYLFDDKDDKEVITEGTCDLAYATPEFLTVIDWKSGQMDSVDKPETNLQLHAYGMALAQELGIPKYKVGLCFLRPEQPIWQWSELVSGSDMTMFNRIKKAATTPAEAVLGAHCDSCYSRTHCSAYMLPVHEGPSALEPFTAPGGLTAENAPLALRVVQAMEDAVDKAKAVLKTFADQSGGIQADGKVWAGGETAGRTTADVKALEAAGMTQYLKKGASYRTYRWRNAK